MKKEFSFYEFVGIIVPSVTLLFFTHMIIELTYAKSFIDFSKIGESIIFVIIAYGIGHLLQGIGNIYEMFFWQVFDGMPTKWLTQKTRFGQTLFETDQGDKIREKIYAQFGKVHSKNYGFDVYNFLFIKKATERIDIFNGNYSLFRGLTIAFLILTILTVKSIGVKFAILPLSLCILSNMRMFRFGKLYAQEVFRTYQNYT